MRDEDATAAARGDVDFCQANDLILPGAHWWKREKDAAARGDVMLLDLCHKPDQPILCYCVPEEKWS